MTNAGRQSLREKYIRWEAHDGWGRAANFLARIGIALAIGVIPHFLATNGIPFLTWATRILGLHGIQITLLTSVIAIGWIAHKFKMRNQLWYGVVEIFFGIGSGASVSFSMSPGRAMFAQLVTLAGCAYVVARGFNNVTEARAKLAAKTA